MISYRNLINPAKGLFILAFLVFLFWILGKALLTEPKRSFQGVTFFPEFNLKDIRAPHALLTLDHLKGKVSVVHVWATWCGVCIKEHEEWIRIKEKWPYHFVGILYRDDPQKVLTLLKLRGNPYAYLLNDEKGIVGLDLGLIGTPESFIVDEKGVVRFHYVGALNARLFETVFLPILKEIENKV